MTTIDLATRTRQRLERALRAIRHELIEEIDTQPSEVRWFGRPHQSARYRTFPKYSPTGERLLGATSIAPDCPRPVKGRCECAPDGSWRAAPGAHRADALAHHAEYIGEFRRHLECPEPVDGVCPHGTWTDSLYDLRPDGLWVCRCPIRAGMDRLRRESMRRHLVLGRLLDGNGVAEAWAGLGEPADPVRSALGICEQVLQWASAEAWAEYDRRPRFWKASTVRWADKSQSQQQAEGGPAA